MFRRTVPSPSLEPPRPARIWAITYVSRTLGTLLSVTVSLVKRAAAISGCAPPVIRSAPCSWTPTFRSLAAAHSREAQAGFRHCQRVLELDLFGRGERAGQLLLRAAARLLGTLDRDLLGVLGHIRQDGDAVRQHLEEATSYEEHLLRSSIHLLNPQRSGLEDRHERGVAREHAQLAVRAIGDDELHVALEKAPLDADDPKRKLHYEDCFFFISSPCARASSMVPTM